MAIAHQLYFGWSRCQESRKSPEFRNFKSSKEIKRKIWFRFRDAVNISQYPLAMLVCFWAVPPRLQVNWLELKRGFFSHLRISSAITLLFHNINLKTRMEKLRCINCTIVWSQKLFYVVKVAVVIKKTVTADWVKMLKHCEMCK